MIRPYREPAPAEKLAGYEIEKVAFESMPNGNLSFSVDHNGQTPLSVFCVDQKKHAG